MKGDRMDTPDGGRLTRRDMLKTGMGGAAAFALTAGGLAVPRGFGSGGGGSVYIEAVPTSPLILRPFDEALPIPQPLAPIAQTVVDTWSSPPRPANHEPGHRTG